MTEIVKKLQIIQKCIAQYEQTYRRHPNSVNLLAVTKGQPLEKILQAYDAGQTRFGENYIQEALAKITALKDKPIEWHFIGAIQSNKTKQIAEHFAWVQSVANIKIAKRLNDQRPPHLPLLNICIEVNISNEESKSGVAVDALQPLLNYCLTLPRLKVRGLMTIPLATENFSEQRKAFHQLFSVWQALLRQGIFLDTLSMGMSGDFEAAIAEGSTMVRIGTAIFGPRS